MESLLDFVKTDDFLIVMFILVIIFIVLTIVNIIMIINANRKYLRFMKKLGNGSNLDEMLKEYLRDVKEIKQDNTELDHDIDCCIQKIGLVRYNAFKDVGSDLSFAIALLDRNDNGVIFNGLYGSESSNIFAKPIKGGISKYQLSEEEKNALEIAEQEKSFIAKHRR